MNRNFQIIFLWKKRPETKFVDAQRNLPPCIDVKLGLNRHLVQYEYHFMIQYGVEKLNSTKFRP